MKKVESELSDWPRPEYKRSDLGKMVRGKYAKRMRAGGTMVLLDPEVAEAFPNDKAVNDALRRLISTTRSPSRAVAKRSKKPVPRRRVA